MRKKMRLLRVTPFIQYVVGNKKAAVTSLYFNLSSQSFHLRSRSRSRFIVTHTIIISNISAIILVLMWWVFLMFDDRRFITRTFAMAVFIILFLFRLDIIRFILILTYYTFTIVIEFIFIVM